MKNNIRFFHFGDDNTSTSWLNGIHCETRQAQLEGASTPLEACAVRQIFGPVRAGVLLVKMRKAGVASDPWLSDAVAALQSGPGSRPVRFVLTTFFDSRVMDYSVIATVGDL